MTEEKVYEAATVETLLETGKHDIQAKKTSSFLYVCSIAACLMSFGRGCAIVWLSPTVSKLRTNDTHINPLARPITIFDESSIAALVCIGAILGSISLGRLCDIIGRLRSMMILSVVQLVGTLMIAFSTEILWYFIGRFAIGVGMGAGISTLTVFLSEISEDHNRGRIGSLVGLSFSLGNLYGYVLGPWLMVRTFTVMCALPFLILTLALISFIPESPVYLASKGKRADAMKSLGRLRDKTPDEIGKEYEVIVNTLRVTSRRSGIGGLFKTRSLRRGLLINVVGTVVMQFSGMAAIMIFAGPLFDAAGTDVSGNTAAIIIGTVQLLSTFLATVSVERLGKRPLLLFSSLGSGVALFALGLFFHLRSVDSPYLEHLLWLPLTAGSFYFVFYGVGLGAIIPSLPAEISPSNVKAISSAIGTLTVFICAIVLTLIFPVFIRRIGPAWCIWGFAVNCILGFFFFYFVLPEIKGKSIIEIQELLRR